MDRDQRSRRQKNRVPPQVKKPRSMQDRVGLQRAAGRPAPPRRNSTSAKRHTTTGPQPRRTQNTTAHRNAPRPQQNPQKAGYRSGAPRVARRVTRAEQLRRRRRKAIGGAICVLIVLIVGIILSINLLFKVTDFRVENPDRVTPANTGIYTEQQIIDASGIQVGDNLLGFSTKEKAAQILSQLPYLDSVQVRVQPPGTVILQVQPAVERFKLEYNGSWLILSDKLKVLRTEAEGPSGLILLEANLPDGQSVAPGAMLNLESDSSLATPVPTVEPGQKTPETAAEPTETANEVLYQVLDELDSHGLLDGTSVISLTDLSELNLLYQGRVSIKLGTSNNLDYKVRLAAYIVLDTGGDGLTSSDRGTLDVSNQMEDGSIEARFLPAEDTTTEPESQDDAGTAGEDGADSAAQDSAETEPTPEPTE